MDGLEEEAAVVAVVVAAARGAGAVGDEGAADEDDDEELKKGMLRLGRMYTGTEKALDMAAGMGGTGGPCTRSRVVGVALRILCEGARGNLGAERCCLSLSRRRTRCSRGGKRQRRDACFPGWRDGTQA
jgi:hypothetical protein